MPTIPIDLKPSSTPAAHGGVAGHVVTTSFQPPVFTRALIEPAATGAGPGLIRTYRGFHGNGPIDRHVISPYARRLVEEEGMTPRAAGDASRQAAQKLIDDPHSQDTALHLHATGSDQKVFRIGDAGGFEVSPFISTTTDAYATEAFLADPRDKPLSSSCSFYGFDIPVSEAIANPHSVGKESEVVVTGDLMKYMVEFGDLPAPPREVSDR